MGSKDRERGLDPTDPPSVLLLAPKKSDAESVETALGRYDLSVSVAHDVTQALDDTSTTDVECIVVSDTFPSMTGEEVLDAIRERYRSLPVVLVLTDPNERLEDRLASADAADYVSGGLGSVSYGSLADRIRAAVATYRTSRPERTDRKISRRLEQRLSETERKITALHSVAMELNSAATDDEVYRMMVTAAEGILDLDICFAFAAEDDAFVPKARSSTPTDRELSPLPLDYGAMGESFRTGESYRIVDMDLHAVADPEFGDYRSGISVPIGEFGVFQAVSKDSGAFDETDLELTELLASHAASVLQRLSFEQELRVERDRYAALFDNSSDCILEAEFVDDEAIIRRTNPAFEEVFGYDESEVVGSDVDEVVVPEDRYDEARTLTNRVRHGEVVQAEVRRRTSDGVRDLLLRSVPVDDDSLFAVYTDITDQKERERTIEEQKERLDAFASTVSHDLRNPLSVARAELELARRTQDEDHLNAVDEAHDRIEALVEDLLVLAREGRQALDVEPVKLSAAVEAAWSVVASENASLVVETEPTIHADEGQLRQLLENLFGNAVEHGGEDVTVTVDECDDGFYVGDDGPGIPPEDREDVFEAGHSTATRGTGLGLRIVEEIVETHGWTLDVTESDGGGARFEITDVDVE